MELVTLRSAREARKLELGKALDVEKTRADNAENKCKELQGEVDRVRRQLEEQDEAKIIEKFKASKAYDDDVAEAGAPEIRRCWLVAERHIKTDPAANWDSFIDQFLDAKDKVEKGLGEPVSYDGPNPAFFPAIEDQVP